MNEEIRGQRKVSKSYTITSSLPRDHREIKSLNVTPIEQLDDSKFDRKVFSDGTIDFQAPFGSQCTELCKATVLLIDDVPFNLIPLESMLT